ncbi:MAG TPA: DUF4262 domain-containing protein [Acidimicrobiia bacterium]
MDGRTLAWQDQERAWLTDTIRKHGWAVEYIGGGSCSHPNCSGGDDEGPPFAYTVGLYGLGHPELLIFSLDPEAAWAVLDAFGERIRGGENLIPCQQLTLQGHRRCFVAEVVPNPGQIVFCANDYYERPSEFSVPVLQLTYDDGKGVYPWDEAHPTPETQPRPGTYAA